MINSTRRIASTLLLLGAGLLVINFLTTNQSECGNSCFGAFLPLALQPDVSVMSNPNSTLDVVPTGEAVMKKWISKEAIRLTSSYALVVGILVLIVLEFFELHYLKILTPHKRRRSRA